MTLAEQQVTFVVLMISGGLGEDCVCVCVCVCGVNNRSSQLHQCDIFSIKHYHTGFLEI